MFNRLRPPGWHGDKTKTRSGREPAQAAPSRTDPPRLELPRHRPPLRPTHLKSVEAAPLPGQPGPGPAAGRVSAPSGSRPVGHPDPRPVSQPVAQPAQPVSPARPVIPPYPVPGGRAPGAIPGAIGSGAQVQSIGRLMLVGPRIRLNGEIKACERLVVEGIVEGEVSDTERLEVVRGGHFHGSAQVDSCMVDGLFDGELDVRGVLTLKANGRVKGTVRYGEIEIERGGVIAGNFGARAAAERQPASSLKAGGPRPA